MHLGFRHSLPDYNRLRWDYAIMSYTVSIEAPCRECDTPTDRRERGTCEPLCMECALKKATDAITQMKQRSGPYYDKWRNGMMRASRNWS